MKTAFAILLLVAPLALADHRYVTADDKLDFSALKTFSFVSGKATTTRPELNNNLVYKKIQDAIRTQLLAKGMTEAQNGSDVVIGLTVGQDKPNGPSVLFDNGVLTISMTRQDSNALIWQGVFTDEDVTPAKFAEKLPSHAMKLFSQYPPKKKK